MNISTHRKAMDQSDEKLLSPGKELDHRHRLRFNDNFYLSRLSIVHAGI
jgi:hypothetical protein